MIEGRLPNSAAGLLARGASPKRPAASTLTEATPQPEHVFDPQRQKMVPKSSSAIQCPRDVLAGAVEIYRNPLGTSAAAITDTEAFATCP